METARKKEPLIFIVEDDLETGRMLMMRLAEEGYTVRFFHDPLLAARTFSFSDPMPDLLITDFEMPGLNGLELAHVCKSNNPDLKIIMASGHTQEKIRREHPVQPDLLCQKPFTFELILMAVKDLLGEKPQPGTGG